MSRVIEILIAIDTVGILQRSPNPSRIPESPTLIDPHQIYVITNAGGTLQGGAGGELILKAQLGQIVVLNETSLSAASDLSPLFYRFIGIPGQELFSPPSPRIAATSRPLPNPREPSSPTREPVSTHRWSSEVVREGRTTHHFHFVIVDRNHSVCGYFAWAPWITLSS